MPVIRHIRRRLADERGVTMVTVMLTMFIVMAGSAAALTASGGDLGLAANDDRGKRAYEAAEAGLHDYLFHLNQNNAYWTLCDNVPAPAKVSQAWNGTGTDPRNSKWRKVPGSTAEYAIEVLPAPGKTSCDTSNAQTSMIDSQGMFRIRATGRVPRAGGYNKRSIVAAFRRRGFIDYLWYTDLETYDAGMYELQTRGRATRGHPTATSSTLLQWAASSCARYYRPTTSGGTDGRGSQRWSQADGDSSNDGQILWPTSGGGTSWQSWPNRNDDDVFQKCTEIQFAPGDVVKGPLHTNDELMVCGSPQFGRTAQDRIEVSAPPRTGFTGWRDTSGCDADPNFVGTFTNNSPILAMPPTNTKLKVLADPSYVYTGRTTIVLNAGNVTINGVARPYPPNGIIYVQNGDCGATTRPLAPLSTPTGCGDAYVQGSYGTDLTIATENDILITEDIIKSGDRMLGLIANNYIRIHHPVKNFDSDSLDCDNNNALGNVEIDAAILSLNRSFTVDYYYCGSALGTLSVDGALAQKYRGPVGQGGSSISNGYLKDYEYDDRLAYRSPPHFLDPVQSAWRLVRQTEQTPAR